jgi:hypothetical protein
MEAVYRVSQERIRGVQGDGAKHTKQKQRNQGEKQKHKTDIK